MDKGVIALAESQAHYLHNVLRRKNDDNLRLFNGKHGEWIGQLNNMSKKAGEVRLTEQIRPQPDHQKEIHLVFAPIKKNRMDWMIEKSVELGVTHLHPILTQNTEVRKIKANKIEQQIIEAAEQCERLTTPILYEMIKLETLLKSWPKDIILLACIERQDTQALKPIDTNMAVIIGPEGGFTTEEKERISKHAQIVHLGQQILRSETASLKALSIINS